MSRQERVTAGRPSPRWAFLEAFDIGADGDPYLDRLRIVQTPWAGLYLHHIHRADRDPDPHDHPWSFCSLILAGGYTEQVWPDKTTSRGSVVRTRGRFKAGTIRRCEAHRITKTYGSVWTLVLVGPRRGEWGFWPGGRYVPWREYVGGR